MRKAYLLLVLAPAAFVYACGGDDSTNQDGGTDATTDVVNNDTGSNDAAKDTGSNDAGNDGSTDAAPDVSITLECLKPANCVDGGNPDASYPPDSGVVCCGTITGNGNTQSCAITGASTVCEAPSACTTSFNGLLTCSSATVRFCSTAAECTEQAYNKCCVAQSGDGGTVQVCANSQIAGLSGGKIVCP